MNFLILCLSKAMGDLSHNPQRAFFLQCLQCVFTMFPQFWQFRGSGVLLGVILKGGRYAEYCNLSLPVFRLSKAYPTLISQALVKPSIKLFATQPPPNIQVKSLTSQAPGDSPFNGHPNAYPWLFQNPRPGPGPHEFQFLIPGVAHLDGPWFVAMAC